MRNVSAGSCVIPLAKKRGMASYAWVHSNKKR
jgi:hypothetical protein